MKRCYLLLVFLLLLKLQVFSQSDCSSALPICTNAHSGGVVNGYGIDDFNGRKNLGCLFQDLQGDRIETNSYWFRVKLAESGQFGFDIIPLNLAEDWDFAVFGPGPTCGALGTPLRCNYVAGVGGYTGVGDAPSATEGPNYDVWIDGVVGEEYVVFINQYDGNNQGFSIEWTGSVIDNNTDPLDCSILVDLGPDRDLCVGKSTVLNATTFGANVAYSWYLLDEITGTFEPIVGENTATLLVTSTGHYKVQVMDTGSPEPPLEDDIVVTFSAVPIAGPATDMTLCDTNNDGFEDFNLESRTTGIEMGQVGMKVTYHESETFAKANALPIMGLYRSSGGPVWARIENEVNDSCFDITSFQLNIAATPRAIKPENLKQCDDDSDGKMLFDLTERELDILDGQGGMQVRYFENESIAIDNKGWIPDPTLYNTSSRIIWVRVEPVGGSDCYAITSFEVEVLESPIANLPENLQICDDNNDGYYSFDFNALKDAEILGSQKPSTYIINYFGTLADADDNKDALPNPYTNTTPYSLQPVYVRISNVGSSACYDTTSFTIQVFDTAFPPAPSEIPDFSVCDDMSDGDDTNGLYSFNLTDYDTVLLRGQSNLVFEVAYFEDPAYVNRITNPVAYSNIIAGRQKIYARITNRNPNNTTCYSDTSFDLEVKPLPDALLGAFDFVQCDVDGAADGVVDFNLSEADTFLALGNTSLNVTYHLTPIDAAEGINTQNKFPFSNATSPIIYGRVEAANGCYRVVQVNLLVSSTSFPPGYHRQLIACDDDSVVDGLHVFNLAETRSEILTLFLPSQNLKVDFYRNENDALEEVNVIHPDDTYLSEEPFNQLIWVRVEGSLDGGCYGIAPVIELIVNPRPEFELDETAIVCLNNLPLTISTFDPDDFYTYEWTNEIGDVVSIQPSAEIIQGGVYTVIATSNLGCVSFPHTISIKESNIAIITQDDVVITDNSDQNSIRILAENLGIGDYEYALDDSLGPYQDSDTFTSVIPGEHTIFVRDKNDCGLTQIVVYVFGFPNFFTPNDDFHNDTWKVQGIDPAIFVESKIYIYDRYGKLMSTFDGNHTGWDGTYGNVEAISSDYWYHVELVDITGAVRQYKGNFSLVRR